VFLLRLVLVLGSVYTLLAGQLLLASPVKKRSGCKPLLPRLGFLQPIDPKYDLPPKHKTYDDRIKYHRKRGVRPEYGPYIYSAPSAKVKPTVVLVHGFGESPAAMKNIDAAYRKNGFNVVSALLPGHGHSQRDFIQSLLRLDDTLDAWEGEIELALKTGKEVGNGKVVLHGFSMGAMIGVQTIQKDRSLADLAVVSSPMIKRGAALESANKKIMESLAKWLDSNPDSPEDFDKRYINVTPNLDADGDFAAGIGYRLTPVETVGFVTVFQNFILKNHPNYAQNSSPVFVAYSEMDRMSDPGAVTAFFDSDAANVKIIGYGKPERARHNDLLRGAVSEDLLANQINWVIKQLETTGPQ